MSKTYERIVLAENEEIDWIGVGFYRLESQTSQASGQWERWMSCDEEDADKFFSSKPKAQGN